MEKSPKRKNYSTQDPELMVVNTFKIQGPDFHQFIETMKVFDALIICREYYAKGISTKVYHMPYNSLIIDYSRPMGVELNPFPMDKYVLRNGRKNKRYENKKP